MATVMTQPDSLAAGVQLFNTGDYWHAHEIWEQGWLNSQEPQKTLYKGVIQAAAALVHWQRGNLKGLQRNWYKARPRLVAVASLSVELDLVPFIAAMDRFVITDGQMNSAPFVNLVR
jgi:predicted metal-dependent hydrolase